MELKSYFLCTVILLVQCSFGKKGLEKNYRHFHSLKHIHFRSDNSFFNENYEYSNPLNEFRNERHKIRHQHEELHWPIKKIAVVEGDIILGGLMMVHEREDTYTCGPVMPQGGIQALEAMLYTLDKLNYAENRLLPNISLGAHILDDCDKDTYGLEMAVDFIKGESN